MSSKIFKSNISRTHLNVLEYGGEIGSVESIIDMWEKRIVTYRDYFKEEEEYGTIEGKRVGPQSKSSTFFGVEGSFRSLNID